MVTHERSNGRAKQHSLGNLSSKDAARIASQVELVRIEDNENHSRGQLLTLLRRWANQKQEVPNRLELENTLHGRVKAFSNRALLKTDPCAKLRTSKNEFWFEQIEAQSENEKVDSSSIVQSDSEESKYGEREASSLHPKKTTTDSIGSDDSPVDEDQPTQSEQESVSQRFATKVSAYEKQSSSSLTIRHVIVMSLVVLAGAFLAIYLLTEYFNGNTRQFGSNPQQTGVLKNGFSSKDYHTTLSDRILECEYRIHNKSPEPSFFEASKGSAEIRLLPDRQGLIRSDEVELWFYSNGDLQSKHIAGNKFQSFPAKHESGKNKDLAYKFQIVPGTQKHSLVVTKGKDQRRLLHQKFIFYCYPNLTFKGAKLSKNTADGKCEFDVEFDVFNCGQTSSNSGVARICLNYDSSDQIVLIEEVYPRLKESQTFHIKSTVKIPDDYPVGPTKLSIVLDVNDSTIERDELKVGQWEADLGTPFIPRKDTLLPKNNNVCHLGLIVKRP